MKIIEPQIRAWMSEHNACSKGGPTFTLPDGRVVVLGAGFADDSYTTLGKRKNRTTRRVTCNVCHKAKFWRYWTRRSA